MRNDITIGNKTITMASNALTPILYRQIFKKDFLREISGFITLKDKNPKDYTDEDISLVTARSEAFARIAFVMAKQAELETAAELTKLTELDYLEWLIGFENQQFSEAGTLTKILDIWKGNSEDSQVESKN